MCLIRCREVDDNSVVRTFVEWANVPVRNE